MALTPEEIKQEKAYALRRVSASAGSAVWQDIPEHEIRAAFEAGLAEARAEQQRIEQARAAALATPRRPEPVELGPAGRALLAAVGMLPPESGRHRAA